MNVLLSANCNAIVYETQDIGGTDFWTVGLGANAGWLSMTEYDRFCAFVTLGATWNAADQLDDLYLEQATTAAGAGGKALTVAKDLSQVAANTAAESFSLECCGQDLDRAGGFNFVRCYIAEAGNTGVDNVTLVQIRHGCRFANDNESACTAHV